MQHIQHVPTYCSLGALALLTLVPVELTAPLDEVELVFEPGTATIGHRIEVSREQSGGDLQVKMGGSPVPAQFLPQLEYDTKWTQAITIEDAHGDALTRTITDAEQHFAMDMSFGDAGMEPTSVDSTATTPLDGVPFVFTEDDDGETKVAWKDDDDAPDDDLLDGLERRVDLAAVLPEDAVEVGATWSASAKALGSILRPSGDLGWEWNSDFVSEGEETTYDGDLELTLAEIITKDGKKLARIELSGDLTITEVRATDLEQVPVADGTATETTETKFTLSGEIHWNLEAHHLHALDIEGEGEGTMNTIKDEGQEGQDYESTTSHTESLHMKVE